jgi:putative MFS transporter
LAENVVGRLEAVAVTNSSIWLILIVASLAQVFDGMDLFLTGYALPDMGREFMFRSPIYGGFVLSATLGGMFIGSLAWSALSDRIGRRPAFMWTVLIYSVGSGLSGLAPSYLLLLVARAFTGFGLGGEVPIANTLVAEFVPARVRGRVLAVVANMFPAGWVVASLAGIFVGVPYGWRVLYFLGVVPAVLSFFIRQWIPESVRYLLRRGDVKGAKKVLERLGAPVFLGGVTVRMGKREVGSKPRFTELYSPAFRQRTFVLSTILFLGFFIAYGFGGWIPSVLIGPPYNLPAQQSFSYALVTNVGAIVISVSTIAVIDRLGRKWTGSLYYMLSAVTFLVFGLLNPSQALGLFLTVAFFAGGWFNGGNGVTIIWGTEIYPTRMRNAGEGHGMAWGRLGGVVAPLLTATLLAIFADRYIFFALFAGISAVMALIMLRFGTETTKRVLT